MLAQRMACLAATAAVALCWPAAPFAFVAAIYSLGFAHYLLAFGYALPQLRRIAEVPAHWLTFAGLIALAVSLYGSGFPLLVYFGLHHAANETYGRRPEAPLPSGLAPALFAFHLSAYFAALRWSPQLAGIDPGWMWVAFALAALTLAATLRRVELPRAAAAPEISAAALVALSLLLRITFLQVVFFHFALWAVLPMRRIAERGGRPAALRYLAFTGLALAAGLALSPLGPAATRLPAGWFTEQFLLWSYLHITLSIALSDAHPRWAVRLFRAAPDRSPDRLLRRAPPG